MSKKKSEALEQKKPEAVATKVTSAYCLSILTLGEKERDKQFPTWATKESFETVIKPIIGEGKEFVQKWEQFNRDTASIALQLFLAREQWKKLNIGGTDMKFIGEFFDTSCAKLTQKEASNTNRAYQAIIQYLPRIARRIIDTEVQRKGREIDANAKMKVLTDTRKQIAETGHVSLETRKALAVYPEIVPAELKEVLASASTSPVTKPQAVAIAEAIEKKLPEIKKTIDEKPASNVRAGSTVDPAAEALANCKFELRKAGLPAELTTPIIEHFVSALYTALKRMQPEPVIAKSKELLMLKIAGQVTGDVVKDIPADVKKVS